MEESPYDSENVLQRLLVDYPDPLAGEQIDIDEPRRWLLVSREMSVPGEMDGAARWSLDHLFLDQDAVPTLVEVKRSTDTRIRREVIGQMLDYAANAVAYWPVKDIKAKFENSCGQRKVDPAELFGKIVGEDHDPAEYWQCVKTNLQAGRIRLVFVADTIPAELRRVVEFLNEQMDPAEVLAIEVKQYIGTGRTTLVPRLLGQSEAARIRRRPSTQSLQWNEESFMTALRERCGESPQAVAKHLLDWLTPQVTYVWWGRGSREGGIVPTIQRGTVKYHVCRMATQGWFAFRFDWLAGKLPFEAEPMRRELLAKINEVPGVHFDDEVLTKSARVPFSLLTNPDALEKLKAAASWLIQKVNEVPVDSPDQD